MAVLLNSCVIPALSQFPGISLIAKLSDGVGYNYLPVILGQLAF